MHRQKLLCTDTNRTAHAIIALHRDEILYSMIETRRRAKLPSTFAKTVRN
ncbi:MAG: hypothetical protein LH472_14370 [Pyrinomonadaceae bacterium]|nr:hypothetical protein [Pyrinomonadaceae bacterium]